MTERDDLVTIHHDAGASVITINRPDRLNAIDPPTREALIGALHEADLAPETQSIVLTGAGRAFCAGGDVNALGDNNQFGTAGRVQTRGKVLMETLVRLEKPLITRVNGAAVGLGATIALMGDIIIMSEDAKIGDRHVNVGLVAGDGSVAIWPQLIGLHKTKELLLTGRLVDGREALAMGLCSHAVPAAELDRAVAGFVDQFAQLPPYSLRATKVSLNKDLELAISRLVDLSLAYEHLSMAKEDHAEAIAAFQEKRPGRFTGR